MPKRFLIRDELKILPFVEEGVSVASRRTARLPKNKHDGNLLRRLQLPLVEEGVSVASRRTARRTGNHHLKVKKW